MVYFSQNQSLDHSTINPRFSLIASLSKQQTFAAQFNFFPEEERKEVMETLSSSPRTGYGNEEDSMKPQTLRYLSAQYIDYPDGKFLGKRGRSRRWRSRHYA
ncbi:MAG: hypothetical protein V8T12_08285 [Parabacteroides johnsonii]